MSKKTIEHQNVPVDKTLLKRVRKVADEQGYKIRAIIHQGIELRLKQLEPEK